MFHYVFYIMRCVSLSVLCNETSHEYRKTFTFEYVFSSCFLFDAKKLLFSNLSHIHHHTLSKPSYQDIFQIDSS